MPPPPAACRPSCLNLEFIVIIVLLPSKRRLAQLRAAASAPAAAPAEAADTVTSSA